MTEKIFSIKNRKDKEWEDIEKESGAFNEISKGALDKEKKGKEKQNNTFLGRIQSRWLDVMKGKEKSSEFEKIDFEEILPDTTYLFGEEFSIKPGDWWKTQTISGGKEVFYPRQFGLMPVNLETTEREKFIEIHKGGILHEIGHHIPHVKVLEDFMREADTEQRILGNLSIGQVTVSKIKEAIRKAGKELKEIATHKRVGPYVGNLLFLHDLHDVTLDIWLESCLKKYSDKKFAAESKRSLNALNEELFQERPKKTLIQQNLASQLKSALLYKAMRGDLPDWGNSGYDLWFRDGFVSREVQHSLRELITNDAFNELTSVEGLDEVFMPRERIKWVKEKKFNKAYLEIRKEFVRLLEKDFENMVNEKIKKFQREGRGSGEKGEDKGGINNFDDLPEETQAEIINQLIDQMEGELIGRPSLSEEEEKENKVLRGLGRDAINREFERRIRERERERREAKGEKSQKESEDKNGKERQDPFSRFRSSFLRGSQEAQRHAASEMERAKLLGISPEEFREFQNKKQELAGQILEFSEELVKWLSFKMKPEKKSHQTIGRLMPGRLPDYLRAISRGEEPRTFQRMVFKSVIPSIDLLFLVDHSGSMGSLKKNEKAAEVVLLFGEAFKMAESELDKKSLSSGRKKREYLRECLITFSDKAILRKSFDASLDDKILAQLYFSALKIEGGFTADAEALKSTCEYIEKEGKKYQGRQRVLSVVIIITDGQGERDKVKEVLEKARNTNNNLFIAVGAGSDTEDVLDTWQKGLEGLPVLAIHIRDDEMNNMSREIINKMRDRLVEGIMGL